MSILTKAEELINGDRAKKYGSCRVMAKRFIGMCNAFYDNGEGANRKLEDYDIAILVDLLKTCRIPIDPEYADNWIDKAGYAGIGAKIVGIDYLCPRELKKKEK